MKNDKFGRITVSIGRIMMLSLLIASVSTIWGQTSFGRISGTAEGQSSNRSFI